MRLHLRKQHIWVSPDPGPDPGPGSLAPPLLGVLPVNGSATPAGAPGLGPDPGM